MTRYFIRMIEVESLLLAPLQAVLLDAQKILEMDIDIDRLDEKVEGLGLDAPSPLSARSTHVPPPADIPPRPLKPSTLGVAAGVNRQPDMDSRNVNFKGAGLAAVHDTETPPVPDQPANLQSRPTPLEPVIAASLNVPLSDAPRPSGSRPMLPEPPSDGSHINQHMPTVNARPAHPAILLASKPDFFSDPDNLATLDGVRVSQSSPADPPAGIQTDLAATSVTRLATPRLGETVALNVHSDMDSRNSKAKEAGLAAVHDTETPPVPDQPANLQSRSTPLEPVIAASLNVPLAEAPRPSGSRPVLPEPPSNGSHVNQDMPTVNARPAHPMIPLVSKPEFWGDQNTLAMPDAVRGAQSSPAGPLAGIQTDLAATSEIHLSPSRSSQQNTSLESHALLDVAGFTGHFLPQAASELAEDTTHLPFGLSVPVHHTTSPENLVSVDVTPVSRRSTPRSDLSLQPDAVDPLQPDRVAHVYHNNGVFEPATLAKSETKQKGGERGVSIPLCPRRDNKRQLPYQQSDYAAAPTASAYKQGLAETPSTGGRPTHLKFPGDGSATTSTATRLADALEPAFEQAYQLSRLQLEQSDLPVQQDSSPGLVRNTFNVSVSLDGRQNSAENFERLGLEEALTDILRAAARRHGLEV